MGRNTQTAVGALCVLCVHLHQTHTWGSSSTPGPSPHGGTVWPLSPPGVCDTSQHPKILRCTLWDLCPPVSPLPVSPHPHPHPCSHSCPGVFGMGTPNWEAPAPLGPPQRCPTWGSPLKFVLSKLFPRSHHYQIFPHGDVHQHIPKSQTPPG